MNPIQNSVIWGSCRGLLYTRGQHVCCGLNVFFKPHNPGHSNVHLIRLCIYHNEQKVSNKRLKDWAIISKIKGTFLLQKNILDTISNKLKYGWSKARTFYHFWLDIFTQFFRHPVVYCISVFILFVVRFFQAQLTLFWVRKTYFMLTAVFRTMQIELAILCKEYTKYKVHSFLFLLVYSCLFFTG